MKKSKWPVEFKLPLADGWFYDVRVFPNKPAMYAHRKEMNCLGYIRESRFNFDAAYVTDCPRRGKQFGVLLFTRGSGGRVEVVTHEIFHAASRWWGATRRARDVFKEPYQEQFAQWVGLLAKRYWLKWWKYFE